MAQNLRPPGLQPPDSKEKSVAANTENSKLKRMLWVMFGLVAALALIVIVFLPTLVTEQPIDKATETLDSATSNQSLSQDVSVGRDDAEQTLKDFLRLRAQPQLSNAEIWAADDWQRALKKAAEGDDLYGRGRFADAITGYENAIQQLQAVLDGKSQRLIESLSSGWQLLQKDDVAEAISTFERALAMQADHVDAGVGLARAKVRKDILRLMAAGSQAEVTNRLADAEQAYRDALQLDAAYVPAQVAAKKVSDLLAQDAFQRAMSKVLQSLDSGRLELAAQALQVAINIRPNSTAVTDVKRRLAEAQRRSQFSRLRRQAERKAGSEEWMKAAEIYRKALMIDGSSVIAQNGLANAESAMRVNASFDHYLADTSRLSSDEPLANAKKLLQANRQAPKAEPRLVDKIASLQEAVRLAQVPVKLLVLSDGLTDVAIYQVGRFGKFQQKELTLRPGRYTLAGSCNGYRDIRKVISLRPETGSITVTMRCEEKI